MKPELRAINNDIWWLDEPEIRPEEPKQRIKTRQNTVSLQQLMRSYITLLDVEIEEIASSKEENNFTNDEITRHQ